MDLYEKERQEGMMEYVLQTEALTKVYGKARVVKEVDMHVERGSIYGFIGKNGAGKTTFMRMVAGLAAPASGSMTLFGSKELEKQRVRIGTLIESPGIYPGMTARENLEILRLSLGITEKGRVEEMLLMAGLSDAGKKKVKHFSMGMKQRLGVALAMLGNPDLLILDEPINGLDPEGIRELRRLVLRLHETGKTILISSHILGELSKISTVYGIIKDGQMIEQITSEALEEKCMDYFQIEADDVSRALVLIGEAFPKVRAEVADSRLVRVYGLSEGAGLIRLLVEKQVQVYASGFHHMDLEEYFISRMEGGRADV